MTTEINSSGISKAIHKRIGVLFTALISGLIIFSIVAFGINYTQGKLIDDKDAENLLLIIVSLMTVACYATAGRQYKRKLQTPLEQTLTVPKKLDYYQNALIIYLALCEVAGISGIIGFILTGNYLFLIIVALMIIAMIAKTPSKKKIVHDLRLNWNEQKEI
jgi:divalent metal cation (Fe/Co/Zn/Cd) transporter